MFQGSSVSRVVLSLKTQSLSFKLYLEKVGKFWKGENEWKENLRLLCCYFLSNQTDFLTERWVSVVRAGREVAFFRWCSAGLIVCYLDFFFSSFLWGNTQEVRCLLSFNLAASTALSQSSYSQEAEMLSPLLPLWGDKWAKEHASEVQVSFPGGTNTLWHVAFYFNSPALHKLLTGCLFSEFINVSSGLFPFKSQNVS